MLPYYLILTIRLFLRDKLVAFINILGLAVGISSCLLIFIYVRHELAYDGNQPNKNRIYRILSRLEIGKSNNQYASSSYNLAGTLKRDYPEIEETARILPIHKQHIWVGNKVYKPDNNYFADSTFFKVFKYKVIEGNLGNALKEPYSIVLSEQTAQVLFGKKTGIMGEMVKFTRATYKVTAVIQVPEHQSHLPVSSLISMNSLDSRLEDNLKNDWFYLSQSTYLLFKTPDTTGFQPKLDRVVTAYIIPWLLTQGSHSNIRFSLQALPEIHLRTDIGFDYSETTRKSYLYIFSLVAVIILLIGCINYTNLATSRSVRRSLEVGIRKVAGASRKQLITLFLAESVIITLVAVIISLCFTELLLPLFNNLSDRSFGQDDLMNWPFLFLLASITLVVGIAAGSYPAFVLSRFEPVKVLKGAKFPGGTSLKVRKGLVIFQFGISIVMIISTLVVYAQMNYMKSKDIGFRKEGILAIRVPLSDSSFVNKLDEVKLALQKCRGVIGLAGMSELPGTNFSNILQFVESSGKREEKLMSVLQVDENALDLLEIKLVAGRNFDVKNPSDKTGAFLINEAAARNFGWNQPLNLKMENGMGYKGKVIGVVRDFNYYSLHSAIEPLVIIRSNMVPAHLIVKMDAENQNETLELIERTWKAFSQKFPYEFYFLDETFDQQYRAEEKMLTVFSYFSGLSILVACMGLFGLSSYTIEQRTKEIGIRKIMGAPVWHIVLMLSTDFLLLVAMAFVLAIPVAWFSMKTWLGHFAYQYPISPGLFIAAGILAFVIALLTVSIQAWKAASGNPAKALRYE